MELWLVVVALGCGFAAHLVRLPPLVGYLIAGFVLHAAGVESDETVETISDIGVLLLLFGIGLKLQLRSLTRPVVWAGASIHAALSSSLIGGFLLLLGLIGLPLARDLSLGEAALVGFAFSFSSTVFAVKALEERNESASLQGRLAIGILIVQDIFAVVFLTVTVDEPPSVWALPVVIAIVAARPVTGWILDRCGHGELLPLLGFALAVGVGAEAFDRVGLKADLGALIIGLTLASHPRASELAKALLNLKDVLLVGFFLSIGLGGTPGWGELAVALAVITLVPLKAAGFFALVTGFRFRVRTAWHTSITLATFSEFGLIVALVGVERELIDPEWTSAIAVAVSISFILAAPISSARYALYDRFGARLAGRQRTPVVDEDSLLDPGDARVLVFGMGRVGTGAYDELVARFGEVVVGIDREGQRAVHDEVGRRIIAGDALDIEFWDRLSLSSSIELVVLTMSDQSANLTAVRRVNEFLPHATVAASALYADHVIELEEAGVDVARNLYGEAGQGLADDVCDLLELPPRRPDQA